MDMYKELIATLLNKPVESITNEERKMGKIILYPSIYSNNDNLRKNKNDN